MKSRLFTLSAGLSLALCLLYLGLCAGSYPGTIFYWQWIDGTRPIAAGEQRWIFWVNGEMGFATRTAPLDKRMFIRNPNPMNLLRNPPAFEWTTEPNVRPYTFLSAPYAHGRKWGMSTPMGFTIPPDNYYEYAFPAWPPVVLFAILPMLWCFRFKRSIRERRLRGEAVGVTRRQLLLAHVVASYACFLLLIPYEHFEWYDPAEWGVAIAAPLLALPYVVIGAVQNFIGPIQGLPAFVRAMAYLVPFGLVFSILFRLMPPRRILGRCVQCGYDLRASPDRCPECGLAVIDTGATISS